MPNPNSKICPKCRQLIWHSGGFCTNLDCMEKSIRKEEEESVVQAGLEAWNDIRNPQKQQIFFNRLNSLYKA